MNLVKIFNCDIYWQLHTILQILQKWYSAESRTHMIEYRILALVFGGYVLEYILCAWVLCLIAQQLIQKLSKHPFVLTSLCFNCFFQLRVAITQLLSTPFWLFWKPELLNIFKLKQKFPTWYFKIVLHSIFHLNACSEEKTMHLPRECTYQNLM